MQKYYVQVHDNRDSRAAGTYWFSDEDCTFLHRVGAPAIVYASGNVSWLIDGEYHRTDGPAIEHMDGSKWWYHEGQLHRDDGPAIECVDGNKSWWVNGNRNRVDGPAVEDADGGKEWWLDGVKMTKKEHAAHTAPAQEMTVAQIEAVLGKKIKIVK